MTLPQLVVGGKHLGELEYRVHRRLQQRPTTGNRNMAAITENSMSILHIIYKKTASNLSGRPVR